MIHKNENKTLFHRRSGNVTTDQVKLSPDEAGAKERATSEFLPCESSWICNQSHLSSLPYIKVSKSHIADRNNNPHHAHLNCTSIPRDDGGVRRRETILLDNNYANQSPAETGVA